MVFKNPGAFFERAVASFVIAGYFILKKRGLLSVLA